MPAIGFSRSAAISFKQIQYLLFLCMHACMQNIQCVHGDIHMLHADPAGQLNKEFIDELADVVISRWYICYGEIKDVFNSVNFKQYEMDA